MIFIFYLVIYYFLVNEKYTLLLKSIYTWYEANYIMKFYVTISCMSQLRTYHGIPM